MTDGRDTANAAAAAIEEVTRLVRSSERINAAMTALVSVSEALSRLIDADNDLGPEALKALEHIGESADALTRAHQFVDARFDVAITGITSALMKPLQEGD